jgi:hypothetical protein
MADHAKALRDDEAAHREALDAKAATLAGFAGVTLSVSATLATSTSELHSPAIPWLLGAGLALLAGSAATALLGILLPQRYKELKADELDRFLEPEYFSAAAPDVQSRTVKDTATVLRHNRKVNGRKARLLQGAAALLAGGLLCVSALALILELDGRKPTHAGHRAATSVARRI